MDGMRQDGKATIDNSTAGRACLQRARGKGNMKPIIERGQCPECGRHDVTFRGRMAAGHMEWTSDCRCKRDTRRSEVEPREEGERQ